MPYTSDTKNIPIHLIQATQLDTIVSQLTPFQKQWLETQGFKAEAHQFVSLPDETGRIAAIYAGYDQQAPLLAFGEIALKLPQGQYELASQHSVQEEYLILLGWGLTHYQFTRYQAEAETCQNQLYLPPHQEQTVRRMQEAYYLVRDLVNTPPIDLGPNNLLSVAESLANEHGAHCSSISGERLENECPAIHAVGMGSSRAPMLIQLEWGDANDPVLCLAGKGVVFDTGGLNIKSGNRMLNMKKDMGGSAHVLALAKLIMEHQLPVQLKVYIAAVENMISGHAYRPSDVIHTRRGLTVEIVNTDAEGRVVLSDALQLACEANPDLIIDFATLTGAARIAMGPDVPPFFTNRDEISDALMGAAETVAEQIWPLPLVDAYERYLASQVADITNCAPTSFAGAINAALFLRRFVDKHIPWIHFDVYAWNDAQLPTRPAGGEAQALRSVFEFIQRRYPTK